jgi:multiple sugar transport system substrate-binding protein
MARRRAALAAIGAAALFLSLAAGACGRARASGVVTIEFWGLGKEAELVAGLLPEFERRHPGRKVNLQQIPFIAGQEKLLTAYAGRSLPDLAQIGNTWIPQFAELGALEALDGRVAGSSSLHEKDFFPGIWATNQVEGRLYGVPWYVDTRVLFYRPDLMANAGCPEPPRSWERWVECMRRLRENSGGRTWAILLPTDEYAQPLIFGIQKGSTLLRDGGRRGAFSEAPFLEASRFYIGLFHQGLAPPVSNTQVANVYQEFDRGEIAIWITGPWNLGEFRRRIPEGRQHLWATAPLPAPREEDYPGISWAGGSSLAIFSGSPRREEAWKLIEYLSEPEQQRRFYALSGDLPARIGAWDDPGLASDPKVEAFRLQLQRVAPMPAVMEWERISLKVAEHLESAIRGRESVEKSLADLDEEVDRILAKRRWVRDRQGSPGR